MQRKKTVLVVDDNPDMLRLLQETLEANNFECVTASSAMEGLEKASSLRPDLILLDLMLPEMSGFGFMRELRQNSNLDRTPVVVLSALVDEEVATEALDLGAVGYLTKACDARELLSMVREYAISG